MAAKAGKKGKKKGTTMALTDFLSDETGTAQGPGSSYVLANKSMDWAAEMEELDIDSEPSYGMQAVDRAKLPTAPKASRGPEDLEKVPKDPPFTAFIGNLPYEATEEKITEFFRKLPVMNVRLPEDNGRLRGFGYVQFETREALIDALSMSEESFGGRKVRIDLAGESQGDNRKGGRRDDGLPDRTEGDWRRSEVRQESSSFNDRGQGRYDDRTPSKYDDRGPSRYDDRRDDRFGDRRDGGGFDDRRGGGGFDDRRGGGGFDDRRGGGGFDDRRGGGFDDRRGGGFEDRRGGGGFDDRRGGGGFDDRRGYGRRDDRGFGRDDRGGGFGGRDERRDDRYGGGRYDDREGGRRQFGGGFRRDDRGGDERGWERGGGGFHGDRDRGGDRGQDDRYDRQDRQEREPEAPKERPRLQLQPRTKPVETQPEIKPVEEKPRPEKPKAASIFGSAKPVDTAQREREIEEKLMKQKTEPSQHKSSLESRGYGASMGFEEPRKYEHDNKENKNVPSSRRRTGSERSDEGDGRRERRSSGSSKAKKGSTSSHGRSRQDSGEQGSHPEVFSGGEEDRSQNAVSPAHRDDSVKLVPAPAPKENIWEKRKSTQTAQSPPQKTDERKPPSQESSPADTQQSPPNIRERNQSNRSNRTSSQSSTDSTPSKREGKKEFVPAEPPKENPWMKRKQEREQHPPAGKREPGPAPVSNQQNVSNAWGRGGGDRGRGRGGRGGFGRGRGEPPRQSKEKKEKPLPKSVDEMPKYEDKKNLDFSDGNKFAGLVDDEDSGTEES